MCKKRKDESFFLDSGATLCYNEFTNQSPKGENGANKNMKLSKILMIALCLLLCLTVTVGCDTGKEPNETEPSSSEAATTAADDPLNGETTAGSDETTEPEADVTTDAPASGIGKSEWESRLTAEVFENYTVLIEGEMTVFQNGEEDSTDEIWQKIKITSDKMELSTMAVGEEDPFMMVFDGEIAAAQKLQNSQLFMLILSKYDSFVYDAATDTYSIPETIVLNEIIKGIGISGDEVSLWDIPTQIEFREAVVTFTSDGMLSTLVCDYTQTMEMYGATISASGKTTWTFTDFGTTVIE